MRAVASATSVATGVGLCTSRSSHAPRSSTDGGGTTTACSAIRSSCAVTVLSCCCAAARSPSAAVTAASSPSSASRATASFAWTGVPPVLEPHTDLPRAIGADLGPPLRGEAPFGAHHPIGAREQSGCRQRRQDRERYDATANNRGPREALLDVRRLARLFCWRWCGVAIGGHIYRLSDTSRLHHRSPHAFFAQSAAMRSPEGSDGRSRAARVERGSTKLSLGARWHRGSADARVVEPNKGVHKPTGSKGSDSRKVRGPKESTR